MNIPDALLFLENVRARTNFAKTHVALNGKEAIVCFFKEDGSFVPFKFTIEQLAKMDLPTRNGVEDALVTALSLVEKAKSGGPIGANNANLIVKPKLTILSETNPTLQG